MMAVASGCLAAISGRKSAIFTFSVMRSISLIFDRTKTPQRHKDTESLHRREIHLMSSPGIDVTLSRARANPNLDHRLNVSRLG